MPLPDPIPSFAEIQPQFEARVRRITWAQLATIDAAGRPRNRVVHPVWEGNIAWITTDPASPKMRQVARKPWGSLGYWDNHQTTVTAEVYITAVTDPVEKVRVASYIKSLPEPYGFDPSFWGGTPEDPGFVLMRCEAYQVELAGYPKLWEWAASRWTGPRPG